jgi:hypothetical protein
VLSAVLVAVTVTVCAESIDAGAKYCPVVDIVPDPAKLHRTAVLEVPVTVAVNCWVPFGPNWTVVGDTLTVTAGPLPDDRRSVTWALADLVLSAVRNVIRSRCVDGRGNRTKSDIGLENALVEVRERLEELDRELEWLTATLGRLLRADLRMEWRETSTTAPDEAQD